MFSKRILKLKLNFQKQYSKINFYPPKINFKILISKATFSLQK